MPPAAPVPASLIKSPEPSLLAKREALIWGGAKEVLWVLGLPAAWRKHHPIWTQQRGPQGITWEEEVAKMVSEKEQQSSDFPLLPKAKCGQRYSNPIVTQQRATTSQKASP